METNYSLRNTQASIIEKELFSWQKNTSVILRMIELKRKSSAMNLSQFRKQCRYPLPFTSHTAIDYINLAEEQNKDLAISIHNLKAATKEIHRITKQYEQLTANQVRASKESLRSSVLLLVMKAFMFLTELNLHFESQVKIQIIEERYQWIYPERKLTKQKKIQGQIFLHQLQKAKIRIGQAFKQDKSLLDLINKAIEQLDNHVQQKRSDQNHRISSTTKAEGRQQMLNKLKLGQILETDELERKFLEKQLEKSQQRSRLYRLLESPDQFEEGVLEQAKILKMIEESSQLLKENSQKRTILTKRQ